MKQKKLGAIAIICTIALTSGLTYAALMLYVDVPMSIEITGEWGLGLYMDANGMMPLTSLDFGTLKPGDSGSLGPYYIMNSGDYVIYLSYSLTDWPSDVTLQMELVDDTAPIMLAPDFIHPNGMPANYIGWTFTIHYDVSETAGDGVYSPTLTWNAHDSPSL